MTHKRKFLEISNLTEEDNLFGFLSEEEINNPTFLPFYPGDNFTDSNSSLDSWADNERDNFFSSKPVLSNEQLYSCVSFENVDVSNATMAKPEIILSFDEIKLDLPQKKQKQELDTVKLSLKNSKKNNALDLINLFSILLIGNTKVECAIENDQCVLKTKIDSSGNRPFMTHRKWDLIKEEIKVRFNQHFITYITKLLLEKRSSHSNSNDVNEAMYYLLQQDAFLFFNDLKFNVPNQKENARVNAISVTSKKTTLIKPFSIVLFLSSLLYAENKIECALEKNQCILKTKPDDTGRLPGLTSKEWDAVKKQLKIRWQQLLLTLIDKNGSSDNFFKPQDSSSLEKNSENSFHYPISTDNYLIFYEINFSLPNKQDKLTKDTISVTSVKHDPFAVFDFLSPLLMGDAYIECKLENDQCFLKTKPNPQGLRPALNYRSWDLVKKSLEIRSQQLPLNFSDLQFHFPNEKSKAKSHFILITAKYHTARNIFDFLSPYIEHMSNIECAYNDQDECILQTKLTSKPRPLYDNKKWKTIYEMLEFTLKPNTIKFFEKINFHLPQNKPGAITNSVPLTFYDENEKLDISTLVEFIAPLLVFTPEIEYAIVPNGNCVLLTKKFDKNGERIAHGRSWWESQKNKLQENAHSENLKLKLKFKLPEKKPNALSHNVKVTAEGLDALSVFNLLQPYMTFTPELDCLINDKDECMLQTNALAEHPMNNRYWWGQRTKFLASHVSPKLFTPANVNTAYIHEFQQSTQHYASNENPYLFFSPRTGDMAQEIQSIENIMETTKSF